MIVTKPQFDTSTIKPGNIVRFISHKRRAINNSYQRNCIVAEVTPLLIFLAHYNGQRVPSKIEVTEVRIEEVVSGDVEMVKVDFNQAIKSSQEIETIKNYFKNMDLPWDDFSEAADNVRDFISKNFFKEESKEDELNG